MLRAPSFSGGTRSCYRSLLWQGPLRRPGVAPSRACGSMSPPTPALRKASSPRSLSSLWECPGSPEQGGPLPEAAPVTCRQSPASSSQLPRSLIGRNSRATGFEARPICKGCILPSAIFPQPFFILQATHRTVGTLSSLLGACLWLPRLKKAYLCSLPDNALRRESDEIRLYVKSYSCRKKENRD